MRFTMPLTCTREQDLTSPRWERREERYYLSILTCVRPDQIPLVLPGLWQEIAERLAACAATPSGPPFVRFVTMRTDHRVEFEAALPVGEPVRGHGRVRAGVLPTGTYAVVRSAGTLDHLLEARSALVEWGRERDAVWDSWPTEAGTAWGGCIATFPTYRQQEPLLPTISSAIECRIHVSAANRGDSSRQLSPPSGDNRGLSQNIFAAVRRRSVSSR
jgi:hypothetical protein